MKKNIELAKKILEELASQGVREFCVCPGKRNAPFVVLLTQELENKNSEFQVYFHFEERSAAFFALGRVQATSRPVAVLTTSGTAVAELLPATMEAYYTGMPLVLLTADRPSSYRGSGAPQAAEQVGIFSVYTSKTQDFELGSSCSSTIGVCKEGPTHINVCFDEPLIDESFQSWSLPQESSATDPKATLPLQIQDELGLMTRFLKQVRSPIVLVGALGVEDLEVVRDFLTRLDAPVYLESISGLRENPSLAHLQIHVPSGILSSAGRDYPVDGIIRIGGIPTLRLWRDLDLGLSSMPVLNISNLKFTGLGRRSTNVFGNIKSHLQALLQSEATFPSEKSVSKREGFLAFMERCRQDKKALDELIEREPHSEPSWFLKLSQGIGENSKVYLGNSMPIREWDLAASMRYLPKRKIWASRGQSGIDGQVSSFIGAAEPGVENWALLGDLTALYDLPGPWILSQRLEAGLQVNICVINNSGGKIFERMFPQKTFLNEHHLKFKPWADLWGLSYEEWTQADSKFSGSSEKNRLIEIIPDLQSTRRFWEEYGRRFK